MNPETHSCDCGYTWCHGHSGTHLCGPQYRATIERQEQEILKLHRDLAAEKLRADQGWHRYEAANSRKNELEAERANWAQEITALKVASPVTMPNDGLVPLSVDGKAVWLEGIGAVALDYSSVKSLSDIQDAAEPVAPHDAIDAARLDWLNQNFFSDQKDEWDERQAPNSIKWKFFGPMSVQGNVRDVIDAAITKEQPQ